MTIILHDSFNPQCREGIKSIDYSKYEFIEHIEIDYITGCFSPNKDFREMWGGFCLIKINPSYKVVNTKVNESQKPLFNRAYKGSKHIIKDKFLFLRPLKKIIYTKLGLNRKSDIYS